ncbi:hypothetical protein PILCRDRAFT_812371 [Piloderma croceum F 1598]|uniref:MYND-type domain-containing protein n=1 Tax=Piloderma croceum (strain F 1598) TaxID=765440 RepID=A0A0C3G2Y9_PILCF|nr:hypothetical protein PILCRDRAFT_812371 [Piloderma croceum F 1598]
MLDSYPFEDGDIAIHRSAIRNLCSLQRNVTVLAYQRFTVDDLEEKWLALSTSARQNHLLQGMVRACRRPIDQDERLHCEEVTLPYLQKGNGRGFLDLTRSFMIPDTTTIPTEPKFLLNKRFDQMLRPGPNGQSDRQVFFRADKTLCRNMFICRFLSDTLASIFDQPEKPIVFVKGPQPKMTRAELRNMPESAKADRAAAKNSTIIRCESLSCQLGQSKSGEDVDFMVCSNCSKTMQRRIFYCSKGCQKADWKARHKAICGKPLTLQDAQASAIGKEPPKQAWNTGQESIRNALLEIPWLADMVNEGK